MWVLVFLFNDAEATEIYTLSRHDALPIDVQASDVKAVMDGDLDPFVNGWLRAGCPAGKASGVEDDE